MEHAQAPPHSIEAEMSVVGAILLDNESFHSLDLQADDFYVSKHRQIFQVLAELLTKGSAADLVTVSDQLRAAGQLEQSGGAGYLAELLDYVPTAANIAYYADIVSAKSIARQVIDVARATMQQAQSGADPDQLVADALGQLQSVGQTSSSSWLTLADQAKIYEKYINTVDDTRFCTGFPDLDGIIKGVAPGEVMMIIGYSGTFKSAFLHNILLNSAMKTRKKSLFFSLEMPETLVYQRTVQIVLEQLTYFIESGYAGKKVQENYRENTMKELERLGADNLVVNPRPAITIEQVERETRIARARFGQLGVIGIDYLGLMAADGVKSEYERISYCAEQSKTIAKRLDVPVVVLTQINRQSVRDGKVEMHSAKGSGAVEASADYMLSLVRNDQKQIIVELLKNRNGEANIKLRADLEAKYLKFRSLEPFDEIAGKVVNRGKARLREAKQVAAPDYDPF